MATEAKTIDWGKLIADIDALLNDIFSIHSGTVTNDTENATHLFNKLGDAEKMLDNVDATRVHDSEKAYDMLASKVSELQDRVESVKESIAKEKAPVPKKRY